MLCSMTKLLAGIIYVFHFPPFSSSPTPLPSFLGGARLLPESVFATLPNAQRGVPLVINGDPKGKNILYCNGNSVIIRDIAVSRRSPRIKHSQTSV